MNVLNHNLRLNFQACRLAWFAFAVLITAFTSFADAPYRRYINARDMEPVGDGWVYEPNGNVRIRYPDSRAASDGGYIEAALEKELPPGRYLLIYRALAWNPRSAAVDLEFFFGDTKVATVTPESGHVMITALEVDVAEPWSVFRAAVRSGDVSFRFYRFYISSETSDYTISPYRNYAVVLDDLIYRELEGISTDPGDTPEPANHFYNGSFETGIPTPFWAVQYQATHALGPVSVDKTGAAHGARSLMLYQPWPRFPGVVQNMTYNLMSRVLRLRPNRTYHFRGMFKAEQPSRININVVRAYGDLSGIWGGRGDMVASTSITATSEWTEAEMTFETPDDKRGYFVAVSARTPEQDARVWMDSFMLSDRRATEFIPSAPVEAGVSWRPEGRVFHYGEPVAFKLSVRNYTEHSAEADIRYRVFDYYEKIVAEQVSAGWKLDGNMAASRDIDVAPGKTGAFRLLLDGSVRSADKTFEIPLQEYVFSVLPDPSPDMKHTFGAYINTAPQPVEIMSRAGIRQTVTLSCQNETLSHWSRIEPEHGVYRWRDETVNRVVNAKGVRIIFNLDVHPRTIPGWARESVAEDDVLMVGDLKFSRSAYKNFIEKLVGHYKDSIKHWLIVDEPYHYYSIEQYHELLKATYIAAKRADSGCFVMAHSGYYEPWVSALEKVLPYFDGISGYARNPAQGSWMRKYRDEHGKFLVAVEYGWHATMYQQSMETPLNPRFGRETNVYRDNSVSVVMGALRAMCWSGAEGFNRYDARFPGGDFTQFDMHKCLFEYDGALRPAGVAYAVVSQLLDGMRGERDLGAREGNDGLHPELEVLLLESSEKFALVAASVEGKLLQGMLRLPEDVKVFDIMGNELDQSVAMTFSSSPVYIIGPAKLAEAVKAVLSALRLEPLVLFEAWTEKKGALDQFFLRVSVHNNSADSTLEGKVAIGAGKRNNWERPVHVTIKPGGSAEVEFGLNAYGDFKPRLPTASTVSFTSRGKTASQRLENIFNLGRHVFQVPR